MKCSVFPAMQLKTRLKRRSDAKLANSTPTLTRRKTPKISSRSLTKPTTCSLMPTNVLHTIGSARFPVRQADRVRSAAAVTSTSTISSAGSEEWATSSAASLAAGQPVAPAFVKTVAIWALAFAFLLKKPRAALRRKSSTIAWRRALNAAAMA